MNRIIFSIGLILLFAFTANAQSPEAFKYQAVARDAGGQILANQPVGFRISILQGSVSGANVYSETHAATTNTFGLVSLEIGNGAAESGDFTLIDWGMDTYFVQVELDETGGSNYQLMGASQLLSVAYAMHAKTAESVPGDADGDPTNELQDWSTLPNIPADIADGDHVDDADADPANELELPQDPMAGQMIYYDGIDWVSIAHGTEGQVLTIAGGTPTWTDLQVHPPIAIGDIYGGGIVYYLLQAGDMGYDPMVQHGLIAAPSDQGTGAYGCYGIPPSIPTVNNPTNGPGADIGWGASNTAVMVAECSDGSAAQICDDFVLDGYDDWFLPSSVELSWMYTNLHLEGLGNFSNVSYSSSSHWGDGTSSWGHHFGTGSQNPVGVWDNARVRPVRAF